jgi:hypothetical protein
MKNYDRGHDRRPDAIRQFQFREYADLVDSAKGGCRIAVSRLLSHL